MSSGKRALPLYHSCLSQSGWDQLILPRSLLWCSTIPKVTKVGCMGEQLHSSLCTSCWYSNMTSFYFKCRAFNCHVNEDLPTLSRTVMPTSLYQWSHKQRCKLQQQPQLWMQFEEGLAFWRNKGSAVWGGQLVEVKEAHLKSFQLAYFKAWLSKNFKHQEKHPHDIIWIPFHERSPQSRQFSLHISWPIPSPCVILCPKTSI